MYENMILIPYRDRKEHLEYFLKNSLPLLQEHVPNMRLVVIEQVPGKLFNRGKLLNIGFSLYKNETTYFITHDVDVNPLPAIIKEYTDEVPKDVVKGIYTSGCNTLGGIIKIQSETIHRCNGFPNDFWGWGVEDKALQNRCDFFGVLKKTTITNADPERENYFTIFNDVDDRKKDRFTEKTGFEYNTFPTLHDFEKVEWILTSGVHNIGYILKKKETNGAYDHIWVDI
jgi:hypothetical protein